MTTAAEPIKISGELTPDPSMCLFHVNRPITEGWTLIFEGAEDGKGSVLIDQLFAIEGVVRVMVNDSTITVTKQSPTPWPHMAPELAKAIRQGFAGPAPAIAPAVIEELQNAPMDGVEEAIAELFEERINPALGSHGGFVKLIKVEDRDVYVEMGGGCQGCASSKATMKFGVESAIRRIAPQIRHIIDSTDHASGTNPYYK